MTLRPMMQFGAFMVLVTLTTIMKTSKLLTKNMSPKKRSADFNKWEEDHLAGTTGCDRVMKLDVLALLKKGSEKLCTSFKNPQSS